ncbi:hypothetical protein LJR290_003238 [Variovorax sp. LjRoot290]|uniref:hypothetical protein n=1 Tax=Variovorax sp. LjRoot290 TaxID=3342316 RepID=UPI003ECEDF02
MKHGFLEVAAIAVVILITACTKQDAVEVPKFDPKHVAVEADKGNLGPLKDLNAACSAEVEKSGKRGSACNAQDEVGALRKPLKLQF